MGLVSSPPSLLCAETPDDVASCWERADEDWGPLEDDAGLRLPILLAAEPDFVVARDSLSQILVPRQTAVNWILKVNEFYRFRPVTAFLAVNYLDRFLASNKLPGQNGESGGWPMQLLSVACVSVAAKMEESDVPLLSDLQILDPKFVFESKTIRRMELLLMSALNWRLRTVTPFDFIGHFGYSADPGSIALTRPGLMSRAADLIVETCRAVEFVGYRMSEIGAAVIIGALKEVGDQSDNDLLRCFNEWVNEEAVMACLEAMKGLLMVKYVSERQQREKSPVEPQTPESPIGIIEAAACRSCDSQRSSASGINDHPSPIIPPPTKRRRLHETFLATCPNKDQDENV